MHPSELFKQPPDVTKLGIDIESEHPKFEFDPQKELRAADWQDMGINIQLSVADEHWQALLNRANAALSLNPDYKPAIDLEPIINKNLVKGWHTLEIPLSVMQYNYLIHPEIQLDKRFIDEHKRYVGSLIHSQPGVDTDRHIETVLYTLDKVGHHQATDNVLAERYRRKWEIAFIDKSSETIDRLMTIFGDHYTITEEEFRMLLEKFRARPEHQPANLGGIPIMDAVHLRHIAQMMNNRTSKRPSGDIPPLPEIVSF